MAIYRLKRKTYASKFDDTDMLKQMKDSDILEAKEKKTPGYAPVITSGVVGAGIGAGAGGAIGGIRATGIGLKNTFSKAGTKKANFWKRTGRGAKWGAVITGGIMAANALRKRNEVSEDNQFYNERLGYAKRQAARRERRDWKRNMTQRDGYSY